MNRRDASIAVAHGWGKTNENNTNTSQAFLWPLVETIDWQQASLPARQIVLSEPLPTIQVSSWIH
jgi:hypothetical protein